MDIGIYGIVLAIIYILFSCVMFTHISFENDQLIENRQQIKTVENQQSLVPFFSFSIVLIFLSFLLDHFLEVNMLTIVSLLAIVLPVFWGFFTRVIKYYANEVLGQVKNLFMRLKNELAVFISAGFFGMAISQTEIGAFISNKLFIISSGSVYFLSVLIVVLTIVLAQLGFHPIIIVIGIGSALSPDKFGVSPEYMALVLLVAWTTATQMSPFSGQVLMASQLINQTSSSIIKQNYKFALFLAVILISVVYLFLIVGWL
jgi:TRAP-type C4-dicarboxylate transport system permease large subunit